MGFEANTKGNRGKQDNSSLSWNKAKKIFLIWKAIGKLETESKNVCFGYCNIEIKGQKCGREGIGFKSQWSEGTKYKNVYLQQNNSLNVLNTKKMKEVTVTESRKCLGIASRSKTWKCSNEVGWEVDI